MRAGQSRPLIAIITENTGQPLKTTRAQCAGRSSGYVTLARGIIAMKLNANLRAASQCRWWDRKLRGTKTSMTFNHEPKKKNL